MRHVDRSGLETCALLEAISEEERGLRGKINEHYCQGGYFKG